MLNKTVPQSRTKSETSSGDSIDKMKDLAKDYFVSKADDAKDTLKTISKVADTASDFIA